MWNCGCCIDEAYTACCGCGAGSGRGAIGLAGQLVRCYMAGVVAALYGRGGCGAVFKCMAGVVAVLYGRGGCSAVW
jgi:hypothetical protein